MPQQRRFFLRAGDRDAQSLVIRDSGHRLCDGLVEEPLDFCVCQRFCVYAVNIRRLHIDGEHLNSPHTVPADALQQVYGADSGAELMGKALADIHAIGQEIVEKRLDARSRELFCALAYGQRQRQRAPERIA